MSAAACMFALLHLRLDNYRWSAAHPSLPSAPCCLRSLQITSPLSRPSPVPPTHSPRPPVPFARTVSWSSGAALARCAWRAAAAAQPSATIAAAAQAAVAPSSMYSTLQHIKSSEALGLLAARLHSSKAQHNGPYDVAHANIAAACLCVDCGCVHLQDWQARSRKV